MANENPETQPGTGKSTTAALKSAWTEIKLPFIGLVKSPRALWGLNVSYLLEGMAYFGILTELSLFYSENVGLTENQASLVLGFFTCGITLSQLFLGGRADKWGVRKALWLAVGLFLCGRVLLSSAEPLFGHGGIGSGLFFWSIGGLAIIAIAYGMYQPAAYTAVKQFTDPKTAAMGYAMLYGLMNLGSFLIGVISPSIREQTQELLPPNGITGVFWACTAGMTLGMVGLAVLMTRKAVEQATKNKGGAAPGEAAKEAKTAVDPSAPPPAIVQLWDIPLVVLLLVFLVGVVFFLDIIVEQPLEKVFGFANSGNPTADILIRVAVLLILLAPFLSLYLKRRPESPFRNRRFMFFIFVLIPVQTLFAHNWLTLPKYTKYAFEGFVSDNYEFVSNLNPLLIFFLTPLVTALTSRVNVYKMMVLGTLVMAAPTFLLAVAPTPALLYTYIALSTLGEAMWQPRFLQYIAEVAPEGQTGAYMGIGQFPWFLTKMITSFYAGHFLAAYCPKSGPQNTEAMWLIYGCIAMVSPVLLWVFKRWAGAGKGMAGRPA